MRFYLLQNYVPKKVYRTTCKFDIIDNIVAIALRRNEKNLEKVVSATRNLCYKLCNLANYEIFSLFTNKAF